MAQADNLQIQLSAAELQKIEEALLVLEQVLGPKLITLTGKEIQRLPKASDGTLPFIQKSLDLAEQQPQFAPGYIDIPGLRLDLEAWQQLNSLQRRVKPLLEGLNSTSIKLGSEAYTTALAYYNAAQQAQRQGIRGAQGVVEELGTRFDSVPAKQVKSTPNG